MRVWEVAIGAVCFAALSASLVWLDAFEAVYEITWAHEDWQIDEAIVVALAAVFGVLVAALIAVRRQARDLRQALSSVRKALDESAIAKEAKNRFLMSMSHEFRTPLNVIMGFAELLSSDDRNPLTPAQNQYLQHIKTSGERLLRLIQDLIDLSRIDLSAFEVAVETVEIARLIQNCIDDLRADAAAADVSIDVEAPARAEVVANATKLRYVLKNLMANAIAYNRPEGWLRVAVRPPEGGFVAIVVADSGIGIPDAVMPRLFTPFDRLGREGGTTAGGGIGLALSKRLIEAMAGTIEATSRQGVGSTFVVRLPAADPDEPVPMAG